MLVLAPLASASVACKPRGEATDAPFTADSARKRAAELERQLAKNPKDDAAALELAHLQWLHLRATAKAVPTLDRLARQGDPVAQMSRMLIADARLDLPVVRDMAHAIIKGAAGAGSKTDPAARTRVALAELAARYLSENHGELPGDDADFSRFFADVEKLQLPVTVSQPLLSLRASIAWSTWDGAVFGLKPAS